MTDLKTFVSLDDLAKFADDKFVQMLKENKVKDILKAIGLFSDQTITNDILIISQNPEATVVKRLSDWGYYKRKVKENQKGIKVISHVLKNYNIDTTDENGNVFAQGVEKMDIQMGFLFDISQTEGKDYEYLNSNKENVAKYFEAVKGALEKSVRGYEFEYKDIETKSDIDFTNKKIFIKDGLSIDEVIRTLIDNVATVLVATRKEEGLADFFDFEKNGVVYAVNSKLGLDLPEYDFSLSLNDDGLLELKNNLQKVRSVTHQILQNVQNSIEYSVRKLLREEKLEKSEETKEQEEVVQKTKAAKTTKTKTKTKSKQSESEVE